MTYFGNPVIGVLAAMLVLAAALQTQPYSAPTEPPRPPIKPTTPPRPSAAEPAATEPAGAEPEWPAARSFRLPRAATKRASPQRRFKPRGTLTAGAPAGARGSPETPGGDGASVTTPATTPGSIVRYHLAPTPDQAYPTPAPFRTYPICSKARTDGCMQPGGR